ncbi:hypothetical protein M3629_07010 [Paenibacillus polysaccharolyticus]|uniref:hypothetical protein n=1 Tax=Paenibacillus polysaccharolyticus TaxID=582692 RepID=UPI0020404BE0|nr:hypothetical protein [Paenibacillus polysaccharolyticus]MCM3132529.1 hypothetical protein [Paenibacillus polysaccharolyticus]
MIRSGKVFFKSLVVFIVLLFTVTTSSGVSFANQVTVVPQNSNELSETTITGLTDVQEMFALPFHTESFTPAQLENADAVTPLKIVGPVWVNKSFTVTKSEKSVTAVWTISTDSIIRSVNASFSTGVGWTETASFSGPNSGGVTLSQTWTYSKAGTYSIGGVAQIHTDAGPASCFVGPRTVVIFD